MAANHNPKKRLSTDGETTFNPVIHNTPDLPAINWSLVDQQAPKLLKTPAESLPKAATVIITWADAEWAAMEHVFCSSGSSMRYSARTTGSWSGWQKYSKDLPQGHPSDWTYWGYYRLIQIAREDVLLFKSNTHLDWPGSSYLQAMIKMIIGAVKPNLILSIGTAGGAKTQDHVGTVRAVSAGTLYEQGQPASKWPVYSNDWKAKTGVLGHSGFSKLLFAVPTTTSDLKGICCQFNKFYGTSYLLATLNPPVPNDPEGLDMGDKLPQIANETGGAASLLTTSTFVVATTAGNYQEYTCVEMDDAVVGEACSAERTPFGFVRNVSDPVQNADLLPQVQGNWGSAIYDAYGFYTSYNGAVAAWAALI